ncbi:MAG: hypothetical protein GF307_08760 [candidate division Zixibacteria bacterium]|nr:hypothetical protein [candidate division Zixibacteria bacterium]
MSLNLPARTSFTSPSVPRCILLLEAKEKTYTIYFIALLFIVAAIRLSVIGLSQLTPQEAYYWNYAQHPDWSYFDHPPAASLLIKSGTLIFGDNSFGVRFGGVILSSLLALITFLFVRRLFNARVAFYSVFLFSVTWIFAVGAVVTTPDTPMFLFWVLCLVLIYYAVRKESFWLFVLWGLSAGLGFASKYTMALVFPSAFLFLLMTGKFRSLKIWVYFAGGCIASLITAFPVFYWNYLHEWASFAFQTTRRAGEMSRFRFDMFFGFLGSQMAIITPFIFPFVIYAIYKSFIKGRGEKDNRYILLFCFSAPIIILFTLVSFRGWVKMNWPVAGYFPGIIALCALFEDKIYPRPAWMKRTWRKYAVFAVSFAIAVTSLSYIHSFFPILPMGKADTMAGWRETAEVVDFYRRRHIANNPNNIIGYEYKIASEMAFYTEGKPDTKSDNYVGRHGLSYRFWSDPRNHIGEDFLFVYDSRYKYQPESALLGAFKYISPVRRLKIYGIGGELFSVRIIKCYEYQGVDG